MGRERQDLNEVTLSSQNCLLPSQPWCDKARQRIGQDEAWCGYLSVCTLGMADPA